MGVPVAAVSSNDHRRIRPIAAELTVVGVIYLTYRAGRGISRDAADEALRNAADVVHAEQVLGIFHEQSVQDLVLQSRTLIEFLNRYYVGVHFPATIAFLVWAYLRHIHAYRRVRTWFAGVTLLALGLHVVYPLAPPRMTAGFVDTLRVYGPQIYTPDTTRSVANQFAAMPSLHFGWALMLAVSMVAIKRNRRSLLVLAHPAVTLLAIVATGNHYWLDAIVVTLLAASVGAAMLTASHSSHRSRTTETLPTAVSVVAARGALGSIAADYGSAVSPAPGLRVADTTSGEPSPRPIPTVTLASDDPLAARGCCRSRCHRRPLAGTPTPMTDHRERAPIGRGVPLTVPSHGAPISASSPAMPTETSRRPPSTG